MSTQYKFNQTVNNAITKEGTGLLDSAGNNFNDVGDNLKKGKPVSALMDTANAAVDIGLGVPVAAVGAVGGAVVGGTVAAAGAAYKGAKYVGGKLVDAGKAVGEGIVNAGEGAGNLAANGARSVQDFGDKRADAADAALTDAKKSIQNMDKKPITGLVGGITNTLDAGLNGLTAIPGKVVDGLEAIGNLSSSNKTAQKANSFDADMALLRAQADARNARAGKNQAHVQGGEHISDGATVAPISLPNGAPQKTDIGLQ